jgi:hypothetical protein
MPASTWDASNRLPAETQGVSKAETGTSVAATTGGVDPAAQSSVLRQILLDSGLQVLQDGSRAPMTDQRIRDLTLPTTLPQVEHVDVFKIILAVGSVASELQLARPTPQGTIVHQAKNTEPGTFGSVNHEHTEADNLKGMPPPTGTRHAYSEMSPLSNAVSALLRPPQESDHDTSPYLETSIAADSALKSLGMQQSFTTMPLPLSNAMQAQTLILGSTLSFGSVRLSVLPHASGLALSDGSTLRLEDGETAEIKLPDGGALEIFRSGSMYLVATRSGASMSLPNGASTEGLSVPARTTEQITSEDTILSHSVAQGSIGVATDGTTSGVAAEVFAGAASVCSRGVRSLLMGTFVALVWLV